MTTMNISLPETLKDFVDHQVQERGYGTSSEYVRDLIRNDQVRQAEQRLAALILEGLRMLPVSDFEKHLVLYIERPSLHSRSARPTWLARYSSCSHGGFGKHHLV